MLFKFSEQGVKEEAVRDAFRELARILIGVGEHVSGTVTFATSGTAAVTFDTPVELSDYQIFLSGNANETFWPTSKTVSGFTANSSNASSVAVLDWLLID